MKRRFRQPRHFRNQIKPQSHNYVGEGWGNTMNFSLHFASFSLYRLSLPFWNMVHHWYSQHDVSWIIPTDQNVTQNSEVRCLWSAATTLQLDFVICDLDNRLMLVKVQQLKAPLHKAWKLYGAEVWTLENLNVSSFLSVSFVLLFGEWESFIGLRQCDWVTSDI